MDADAPPDASRRGDLAGVTDLDDQACWLAQVLRRAATVVDSLDPARLEDARS